MTETTDEKQRPVIVNPVLGYGYVRLKNTTFQETRDSLLATFENHEFGSAKDVLWSHMEAEKGNCAGLGKKPTRRNSTTRSSTYADCEDVLKALLSLEQSGHLPTLAVSVDDLLVLPPILPQLSYSRRVTAQDDAQDQVRLSQEAMTSIQEAQERMSAELSKMRKRLDESGAVSSDSAPVQPNPRMRHHPFTTDKASESGRTYSDVTSNRPPRREVNPPPPPLHPPQDGWNKVKRRRKPKVVTGTATDGDQGRFLGAPPVGSLFVFRVCKEATAEDLQQWLKDSKKINVVAIRVMSHPDAALRSFKVSVLKDCVKDLLCADFGWPAEVKVRRFTPRRG
eukprot:GHVO01022608.1.p1 GENE.GHVO01022608.1~~GHVO01022608.1.p1  ORF type:complete len:338 (-),score=24.35 GHVO01022608.1:248-1261(-)